MLAIISNNCWGGAAYQEAGILYNTPTIGLWFYADDYIRFLSSFRRMTSTHPISFLPSSSRPFDHPTGLIDGVHVQFFHYANEDEAGTKWAARCDRLPDSNDDIVFKICDRDGVEMRHLEAFDALPFRRKIGFMKRGRFDISLFPWAVELDVDGKTVPDARILWEITKSHEKVRDVLSEMR